MVFPSFIFEYLCFIYLKLFVLLFKFKLYIYIMEPKKKSLHPIKVVSL